MKSLDLIEAAEFLKMHPESLRRQAKAGNIPGRKTGKCWVFIDVHLADWVSGRYPVQGEKLRVIDGGKTTEINLCPSINVAKIKRGGLTSQNQTAKEYAKALEPKTNNRRKSCTIK